MFARSRFGLLLVIALAACDKDMDPVDVPFEGIEVPNDDKRETPPVADTAPTSGADSDATPPPRPVAPTAAPRLGGCCAALRGAAQSSRDEGDRKMNDQAARVCGGLMTQVKQGKMTESAALSQVRSTLLGRAPAACR